MITDSVFEKLNENLESYNFNSEYSERRRKMIIFQCLKCYPDSYFYSINHDIQSLIDGDDDIKERCSALADLTLEMILDNQFIDNHLVVTQMKDMLIENIIFLVKFVCKKNIQSRII